MNRPLLAAVLAVLTLAAPAFAEGDAPPRLKRPRLDVVFAIDTTGSMGDEIDVVKQRLQQMVAEIGAGRPKPDVRFGMVAYKDRGDEYVVHPVPLSRDVNAFYAEVRALSASGGGDEPEDVAAALTWAIDRMNWDKDREVTRLLFLIGDAGPHHYPGEASMTTLAARAKEKRIKINTIGCSGLVGEAEEAFRTLALRSGGKFDVLTYRQIVATADGHKRTVLTRGGETFAADGELSDEDWKKGADVVARAGVAKKVTTGGWLSGAGAGVADRAAPGRSMAPSAVAPVTVGENNLDALITSEIKASATKAGVAY
ncbi:MAG: VWA domain-containing protein [Myxococcaceae bacterium]|nr:VWA domain-containing protein [Myxococcaceae bacterium]